MPEAPRAVPFQFLTQQGRKRVSSPEVPVKETLVLICSEWILFPSLSQPLWPGEYNALTSLGAPHFPEVTKRNQLQGKQMALQC